MKTTMENKLSMYEATIEVLDINTVPVATIPALVTAKSDLVNIIMQIRAANLIQQMSTKGKTMDKGDRKNELADTAYAVAGAVQALATDKGENDLYMLVNFSRTRLRSADDEEIQQLCQLIHDEANTVVASLLDYGVDEVKLEELQGLIDAWSSRSQAPRVAISERAAATSNLPNLFSAADEVLKKRMDKLMEQFYVDNRTFYDTYKKARKIVNAGRSSTSDNGVPTDTVRVSGNVKDGGTDKPIVGAAVQFISAALSEPLKATTDDSGNYLLNVSVIPEDPGISGKMEVSAGGYGLVSEPTELMAGNAYVRDFSLIPEPMP